MSRVFPTPRQDETSTPTSTTDETIILTQVVKAEACYQTFLLSEQAPRMLHAAPGLGVTIPLYFIQCEGMASSATGLVVRGSLDPDFPELGFDLGGQFALFSTDDNAAGDFIIVNGWVGTSEIRALRREGSFLTPTN